MSFTSRQSAAPRGGRRPASLADSQLQHLENMVDYVTRTGATRPDRFDHGYWEQRIRVLEDTHELIASQRSRIARLRGRLGGEAGSVS
ncbi:hypothetical protein [Paraburkholderia antibiotica]|uniref:Uncharacterized protein n=1 Tax=Paraburkholderia antibiotica TaxID=2728839 RepID=A0A7X9ZVV5_9BURK|nr:hypothetical protein [Paraburkholderia antibiotica]NML30307.1 hypothetical protein [Paraburkholderia antibiotica]